MIKTKYTHFTKSWPRRSHRQHDYYHDAHSKMVLILACILTQMLDSFCPSTHSRRSNGTPSWSALSPLSLVHLSSGMAWERTFGFPALCPLAASLPLCSARRPPTSPSSPSASAGPRNRATAFQIEGGKINSNRKVIMSILPSHSQETGCVHNRRWSLSTGHFLQSQTASCHNYGSRWSES